MFTGIIEELGIVTSFIRGSQSAKLSLSVSRTLAAARVGDSISVNGVCLTVSSIRRNFFEFDISAETVKRSTLGDLKIGDKVNLERALAVAGRLGGHLVSGHVDGVGEIRKKIAHGKAFDVFISVPSTLLKYLVPKGSIAVNGVSLTVADIRSGLVMVSIVPQTARTTNLDGLGIGDKVNVEVDLISKYIEKHLNSQMKGLGEETLSRVGYLPMGWVEN